MIETDDKAPLRGKVVDAAQLLWGAARDAHRNEPTIETELRSMGRRLDELAERLRKGTNGTY